MDVVTLLPIALALIVGYVAGRFHQHHRASLLAENIHWVGEYNEAIKGADLDADVAAHRRERLSGEHGLVQVGQPANPVPIPISEARPIMEMADSDLEVPEFMADSGYRPPQPGPDAVWCIQLTTPDAPWCALYENREPTIGETEVETRCGWIGDLPAGLALRRPSCVECVAFGRYDDEEAEDGSPWDDDERAALTAMQMRTETFQNADGPEDPCPGCDGTLMTLDDGSRWCPACTKFWDRPDIDTWPGTAADDTSSTGPRSVLGPRGRVSD